MRAEHAMRPQDKIKASRDLLHMRKLATGFMNGYVRD